MNCLIVCALVFDNSLNSLGGTCLSCLKSSCTLWKCVNVRGLIFTYMWEVSLSVGCVRGYIFSYECERLHFQLCVWEVTFSVVIVWASIFTSIREVFSSECVWCACRMAELTRARPSSTEHFVCYVSVRKFVLSMFHCRSFSTTGIHFWILGCHLASIILGTLIPLSDVRAWTAAGSSAIVFTCKTKEDETRLTC